MSLPSFGSHSTVTNVAVKPGDPTLMGVTHSDGAVRFWETETGYCNRDMERKVGHFDVLAAMRGGGSEDFQC